MLGYLENELDGSNCDHTLRLTRKWVSDKCGGDRDAVAALAGFGGYCDCEVLANVTPDKFGWHDRS